MDKPTIFDVANWFLAKEAMSHKKLQKLCYYAQAWSQTLLEKDIAKDADFQAWVHGPVNTNLWHEYKKFGYIDIKQRKQNCDFVDETQELLENVWETYGHLSGYELESLTHQEDPWKIARENTPAEAPSTKLISKDDMRAYYRGIYSGEGVGE